MQKSLGILNGPNLNLLGEREPALYGQQSMLSCLENCQRAFPDCHLEYFQSNWEGEIIDKLHQWRKTKQGIVINAGAFSHTSLAIADAIRALALPVVQVHISNTHQREPYRKNDYVAEAALGQITGLGIEGYALAIEFLRKYTQPKQL
jgi:3-dehydroquinate dehydratase II